VPHSARKAIPSSPNPGEAKARKETAKKFAEERRLRLADAAPVVTWNGFTITKSDEHRYVVCVIHLLHSHFLPSKRLDGQEFLNDTLINFYLSYMTDELFRTDKVFNGRALKDSVHIFSTFFYAWLTGVSEGK